MKALLAFQIFLSELYEQRKMIETAIVVELCQELIQTCIKHTNILLRTMACQVLAKLVKFTSDTFANNLNQTLVEQVINNRDPDARASFALSLGCIFKQLGGVAATAHMKAIVGMLMSLYSDPNQTVHTWALHALAMTTEAGGLISIHSSLLLFNWSTNSG
jgi:hypothetical protein